ncbi:MAG: alpha/beta fold hydrolase [Sphingomonas sp.]
MLILHGTNVPQSGNAAYPFGGESMIGALAKRGLDVWGLDFYGFGKSDRFLEMAEPASANAPLNRAAMAAEQVDAAITFLRRHGGGRPIMLIGDSQGSLAAGIYTAHHPETIARLVLFGPITPFSGGAAPQSVPAYRLVTPQDLWARFSSWAEQAGPPSLLDSSMYEAWAKDFLDSDPASRTRTPPSVRVPNGPTADGAEVASARFPYDPSMIRSDTLIVMGETDQVATLPGAQWLLAALRNAPHRRLTVIGHASHTIQYEAERFQLYDVLADFLTEAASSAPIPLHVQSGRQKQ